MNKFYPFLVTSLLTGSVCFGSAGKETKGDPLFQLGAGPVYSCIDLSRYSNSVSYRGFHSRLVTHLGGLFYLSGEYSTFPVHQTLPVWTDIHAQKFDLNLQISFATENSRTRIYAFGGADRHEWNAIRTGLSDIDQLGWGLPPGSRVEVKRWGMDFGFGIAASLYENIGFFADCRFAIAQVPEFERVRILDVMTTLGFKLDILRTDKHNRKKIFGIGKKVYKWTDKGAQ